MRLDPKTKAANALKHLLATKDTKQPRVQFAKRKAKRQMQKASRKANRK